MQESSGPQQPKALLREWWEEFRLVLLYRTPLAPYLCAVICALLLASAHYALALVMLVLLVGDMILRRSWRVGVSAVVLGVILGSLHSQERGRLRSAQDLHRAYAPARMMLHSPSALIREVKVTKQGYAVTVQAESSQILSTTDAFPAQSRFLLYCRAQLQEGERISLTARLTPPRMVQNFGDFNWNQYYEKQGIAGVLHAEDITVIGRDWWRYYRAHWRERCQREIISRLLEGVAADSPAHWVLPALVLGISPVGDQLHAFRDAGAMHLFVVSGLHVGLLITIVWMVLYFTSLSSLRILGIALIASWLYVVVTGAEPPAVRAALIISLYSAGIFLHRRVHLWNSLMAALLVLLLVDRFTLWNVGVWLSFGVVAVLILVVQRIVTQSARVAQPDPYLPEALWNERQKLRVKIAKWGIGLVTVATVSWLTSSLITAGSFGRVYMFGVVASLLLFPLAFSMMVISAASLLIGFFIAPVAPPLNRANAQLAHYAAALAERIEHHPNSVLTVRSHGYADALTVFDLPKGGAALYLPAAELGEGILIDCGREWVASSIIAPCLEAAGQPVHKIYLSHPDINHIGGTPSFPEAQIIPSYEHHGLQQDDYGDYQIQSLALPAPYSRRADDNVALFRVMTPSYTIGYCSDAGLSTWRQLVASGVDFSCDVLIIGQHVQEEDPRADLLHTTGAQLLIQGRNYYHPTARSIDPVLPNLIMGQELTIIQQRLTGAIQLPLTPHLPIQPQHPEKKKLELFKKIRILTAYGVD